MRSRSGSHNKFKVSKVTLIKVTIFFNTLGQTNDRCFKFLDSVNTLFEVKVRVTVKVTVSKVTVTKVTLSDEAKSSCALYQGLLNHA